jgi:ribosomal protein L30/L7E
MIMLYPRMVRVRQLFDVPPPIKDIPTAVRQTLKRLKLASDIKPGETVAITAGSRGTANVAIIMKTVVEELKATGARPFIVPTMGSHGGATAEGQVDILRHFGITEESMGVPVKSSMDVVKIGETLGFPVYLDRFASEADHIAVVARIKPQVGLTIEIGSGIHKMMAIGLGKHKGASTYHRAMIHHGYPKVIQHVGREVLKRAKIAFALGIVENAYAQTAKIEAALPGEIERKENELLRSAKSWMMRLPFKEVDVLIVNEIGKNISGDGMDTPIIGRFTDPLDHTTQPKITRIIVLDLTDQTYGNAVGIGMADFATKRLVEKIDRHATYVNALTGLAPEVARIPPYFDSDREAVDVALSTIGMIEPESAKMIRIRNTRDLGEVDVSEAYLPLIKKRKDLVQLGEPKELQFDRQGNLLPLEATGP